MTVEEHVKQGALEIPPKFWAVILLILGAVSGGGGHLTFEALLAALDNGGADAAQVSELGQSLGTLTGAVEGLKSAVEVLDKSITDQAEMVSDNQCEIRAAREGTDWRNCHID